MVVYLFPYVPFGIIWPYDSTWCLTCTTAFSFRHVYCQIGRSPKAKERGEGTGGIGRACNDLNPSLSIHVMLLVQLLCCIFIYNSRLVTRELTFKQSG